MNNDRSTPAIHRDGAVLVDRFATHWQYSELRDVWRAAFARAVWHQDTEQYVKTRIHSYHKMVDRFGPMTSRHEMGAELPPPGACTANEMRHHGPSDFLYDHSGRAWTYDQDTDTYWRSDSRHRSYDSLVAQYGPLSSEKPKPTIQEIIASADAAADSAIERGGYSPEVRATAAASALREIARKLREIA